MNINYNQGRNGRKHQTTEVIPGPTDITDLTEENIFRDVVRYIARKVDRKGQDSTVASDEPLASARETLRNRALQKRAFLALSKQETADGPKGTVGERIPMEIRIKQLSLFPGIF